MKKYLQFTLAVFTCLSTLLSAAAVKVPQKNQQQYAKSLALAVKKTTAPKEAAVDSKVTSNPVQEINAQLNELQKITYDKIYNSQGAKAIRANAKKAALTKSCNVKANAVAEGALVTCACNECGPTCTDRVLISCTDLPYVITCPGYYQLECDAQFNVVQADPLNPIPMYAITILSSDVTLDLGGHTLSQCGVDVLGYGIAIGQTPLTFTDPNATFNNITIQNGTVRDFSATGVTAFNLTFGPPDVNPNPANLAWKDLHFYDLNILHNGTNTAYFDFTQGLRLTSAATQFIDDFLTNPIFAYQNVIMERVHVNENYNGIINSINAFVGTVNNLIIRDSQFNNTEGLGAFGLLLNGHNIEMTDSQVNGTSDHTVIACNRFLGAIFSTGNNVTIKNSQFNDCYSECCGIRAGIFSGSNILLEDCQFNNAHGGEVFGLVTGDDIEGLLLSTPDTFQCGGATLVRCQSNYHGINSANPGYGYIAGYHLLDYADVNFIDCQSCGINAEAPLWNVFGAWVDATGFLNTDSKNSTFTRFKASDLSGHQSVLGIFGNANRLYEKNDQTFLGNMLVEDCVAENIHSTSSTLRVAGIANCLYPIPFRKGYPLSMENFCVKGCRVSGVYADSSNPLAAGILLETAKKPVVENNTVSDCQRGILLTGTKETNLGYDYFEITELPIGWQVDPATWPANNPITNNQLFTRVSTGQLITITPDEISQDRFYPFSQDISDWVDGEAVRYNVPAGGIPVQLFDPDACRNQVPYSGEVGATATYEGAGIVHGYNTFWTQYMVGGTITLADSSTATITGFIDRFHLQVTPGLTANVAQSYVIHYPNDGQLVDGQILHVFIPEKNTVVPGFTKRGVIQDNTVNSCDLFGIRDNLKPCTKSVFLSNRAFCNGPHNKNHNYHVHWGQKAPVVSGTLSKYPAPKNDLQNIAITCGKKDCGSSSSSSHHHHHRQAKMQDKKTNR